MGAVYLAVRDDGQFQKRVAIKLLRRGLENAALVRRFHHERQILADLEHPNIARLLDGGTTENGLPYFVMEYVEGLPVNRYCEEQNVALDERLKLFRQICAAVEFAHEHAIIHRDLKPGNILVTQAGTPKLLDFGIAKTAVQTGAVASRGTTLRLMTPEYASPEQMRGERVTKSTDIYSLGVLLYELIAGRRPYIFDSKSPYEIALAICENEPLAPSRLRVEPSANSRLTLTQRTNQPKPKTIPHAGDLDNIVLKALRKEPERRYLSVKDFAEDIRRHLAGLPIIARKEQRFSRGVKFLKRHRVSVVLTTVVAILCLLLGLSLGTLTTGTQDKKSLAVLPLANNSQTPNMEYLADGITDGLIDYLSQLPKLTVSPRNSVFRFKGQTISPQTAGNTLGVKAVLTGSVKQEVENLFINIELIEVQTKQTIWRFAYTGKASELLSIQRQIARDVSNILDVRLDVEQPANLQQQGTENVEAYRLYLRGYA